MCPVFSPRGGQCLPPNSHPSPNLAPRFPSRPEAQARESAWRTVPDEAVSFAPSAAREGIFGPGVFGIAAAEFLADLGVGRLPEAGQVARDLLRPMVGAQQVQEHGHATTRQPRCLTNAKKLLNADRQHRRTARLVGQLVPLAGRKFELRGCQPVEFGEAFITDGCLEAREPVGGGDLIERTQAAANVGEQRRQIGIREWWQAQVGNGRGQPPNPCQKTAGSGLGPGE